MHTPPHLFRWPNFISLKNPRSISAWVHDIIAAMLAWWVAFLFRFNFDIPAPFAESMLQSAAWVIPLQATFFLLCAFTAVYGVLPVCRIYSG